MGCDFEYNQRIVDFVGLLGLAPEKATRFMQIWEERDRQLEDTLKNCGGGGSVQTWCGAANDSTDEAGSYHTLDIMTITNPGPGYRIKADITGFVYGTGDHIGVNIDMHTNIGNFGPGVIIQVGNTPFNGACSPFALTVLYDSDDFPSGDIVLGIAVYNSGSPDPDDDTYVYWNAAGTAIVTPKDGIASACWHPGS